MLNRLYIVIGSLLILLIAFGFVAPYLIDWSDRRPQIESLASEALGTPVRIAGGIDIHFLPQPRVTIDGISVGPEDAPIASIDHAEAILSLTDFLRDRYSVTSLVISGAKVRIDIDETGKVKAPINLPETVNASNVSIANASLSQSAVTLNDARSGGSWSFDEIEGSLALTALRGPFGFNATGMFEGAPYQVRITTSQMNTDGGLQLALFLRAAEGDFSLSAEGLLETGAMAAFEGQLSFRQPPPSRTGSVVGDLVMEADIDATAHRARLTNYILVPDENRASTRMTGAAQISFGATPHFNAVVSGGVVALAPRDARTSSAEDPYEVVRLISELPVPLVPPMEGEISVDIAELDLRAFALRDVRLDASASGTDWTVRTFAGKLPGDTAVGLTGTVGARDGKPWAEGRLTLETDRLDALVQLWKPPDENVPLFGINAGFDTGFSLDGGALKLMDGSGHFDGGMIGFSGQIPETGGALAIMADFGAFDRDQSRAFLASLPEIADDPGFASSFSGGSFEVSAESFTLFDLPGEKLSARGSWSGGSIKFSQVAAGEWGGASFTLSGGYAVGDKPVITAGGRVILEGHAGNAALPVVYRQFGVAPQIQELIGRNLPMSLDLELAEPNDGNVQALTLKGRAGPGDLTLSANLGQGLVSYLRAPMGLRATLQADSPEALAAALGLDVALDTNGGATATLIAEGTPANSMDAQLTFSSPADKLQFTGSVIPSDLDDLRGRGKFEFDLAVPSLWGEVLGLGGFYLPGIKGVSEIAFSGGQSLTLSALNADAGGTSVRGDLVRTLEAGTPLYSGALTLGGVDIAGFPVLFTGGAALLNLEGGTWPDGPFAEADGARPTRGRISVTANSVVADGHALAGNTTFDVIWDARNTRLRGLRATVGGGTLTLDAGMCCTGTPGPRQLTGRLGLINVGLDALVPEAPAKALDARVSGSIQVSGSGETLAGIIGSLTGQGSFSARDIAIAGFNPGAFETIAASDTLLGLDAEQLAALVAEALSSGPFEAPQMDGVLSLAAGTLRADNLAASDAQGKLYGGVTFSLSDLGLGGSWTLAPNGNVGDGNLINESTGRIGAVLGGTITAPEHQLDLAQMVDTIQVRAYELEVERLETLRAEQEARARAAAEERARLMALEAKRQAEEAAAKAEAEAKARAAAEAAARAKAEAEARAKAEAEAKAKAEAEAQARAEAEAKAAAEAAAKAKAEAEAKAAAEAAAKAEAEARAKAEAEAAAKAEAEKKAAEEAAAAEAAAKAQAEAEARAAEQAAAEQAAAEQAAADAAAQDAASQSVTTEQEQGVLLIDELLRDLGESQDPLLNAQPAPPPPEDQPVDLLGPSFSNPPGDPNAGSVVNLN